MERAGIKVVGDILVMNREKLDLEFGSYAQRLYELARGIDHNPVVSNRVRKQVSAEDTFPDDIPLSECEPHIRKLAQKVWMASMDNRRAAKTVVLKLKTREFQSLTRSLTSKGPVASCDVLVDVVLGLLERVDLGPKQLYRLVGVGLSNFQIDTNSTENPVAENAPLLIE